MTFTPTLRSQIVNVITIDDDIFEDYERICLRLTNLTEPCPDSVTLGNDTEVIIYCKFATYIYQYYQLAYVCLHTMQYLHFDAILTLLVIVSLDKLSVYFILPLQ